MQLPSNSASSEAHLDYTSHFQGAGEAWQDAETITAEQRAVIQEVSALVQARSDALRTRLAASEQASEATSRARARFGVRDVVLDLRVMACSDGLLNGPAQRSRSHELYRAVMLGRTASEITNARPREEPELVQRVRAQLAAAPDFATKAGLLADLDEALQKSLDTRDALDDAEAAENQAADAELAARLDLRKALEQAYGKLRAAFPGQREFVESFFPRRKTARRSGEEAETDADTETKGA
jgi:hypothetical protein